MHFLQKELEANEELASAVGNVAEETVSNKVKQGLILDLNPIWLAMFRLADSGVNPSSYIRSTMWDGFGWSIHRGGAAFDVGRLPNLSRHFSEAEYLIDSLYERSISNRLQPFLLRIAARPEAVVDSGTANEGFSYEEERYSLIQIARQAGILTVVETHPLPQLVSAPGSRVCATNGSKGTLGGYVKDSNSGSIFGMTCGHVTTGAALDQNGIQMGTVIHEKCPIPLPSNVQCSQYCGSTTDLDVALIATHGSPPNLANSVASLVGNGQLVDMDGATTAGVHTYEVGAHVVDYEIGGSCWQNLIQFHAPLAGVLPVSVSVATTVLPKGGDSGAWLLRNSVEWAGMVVASNNLFGFALPSTTILKESDACFGTKLSLA
jgi:hypothetical protein